MLTATASAHAQGAEQCNPAYEEADALLHVGGDKLLDARDKLRICARPACKAWMVKECTKSLTEVEARIPSVVFVARDASGTELVDVTVTSGERTLASRLDGRSVEVGPGERVFVFVTTGGRRVSQKAIVKEGEKAQRVTATFAAANQPAAVAPAPVALAPVTPAPVTPTPHAPVTPPPVASTEHTTDVPPPASDGSHGTSGRTIAGITIAGVGVVGLGIGAGFGLSALSKNRDASAYCGQNGAGPNDCTGDGYDLRRSAVAMGNGSTIFFAAGAALVVGGLVLWLTAPSRKPDSALAHTGLVF
jgi:hypothetical protein